MNKFQVGDKVVLLKSDYLELDLNIGAAGTIWAVYAGDVPAYEVTFQDTAGEEFDLTLNADEIAPVLHPL